MEGGAPLRCFVVDIGEGGAVLEFWKPLALRPHFRLQWEALGIGAECMVHYTEGSQVEVRFTSDEGPAIARRFGARVDARSCAAEGGRAYVQKKRWRRFGAEITRRAVK